MGLCQKVISRQSIVVRVFGRGVGEFVNGYQANRRSAKELPARFVCCVVNYDCIILTQMLKTIEDKSYQSVVIIINFIVVNCIVAFVIINASFYSLFFWRAGSG